MRRRSCASLHVSTGSATKQATRSKKLGLSESEAPSYIPSTHFVAAVLHTGRETAEGAHTAKQTWDVDRPTICSDLKGTLAGDALRDLYASAAGDADTLPQGCRGLVRRPDGAVVRRLQALVVVDHLGHQPDHRGGPERELAAHGRDPLERPDRRAGRWSLRRRAPRARSTPRGRSTRCTRSRSRSAGSTRATPAVWGWVLAVDRRADHPRRDLARRAVLVRHALAPGTHPPDGDAAAGRGRDAKRRGRPEADAPAGDRHASSP